MEFRKMVTTTLYMRQKRDIDIKTDFLTLWKKVRVG